MYMYSTVRKRTLCHIPSQLPPPTLIRQRDHIDLLKNISPRKRPALALTDVTRDKRKAFYFRFMAAGCTKFRYNPRVVVRGSRNQRVISQIVCDQKGYISSFAATYVQNMDPFKSFVRFVSFGTRNEGLSVQVEIVCSAMSASS